MVATETLHFMEGNQHTKEEQLVLLFQWQGKPIDNAGKREEGERRKRGGWALKGNRTPWQVAFEYLPRISSSSATPLCLSVS